MISLPSSSNGGRSRGEEGVGGAPADRGCRKLDEDKRSVLPLEVKRRECGASGHSGPWGPAGLRSVPSFLQDTVGAELGRSISWKESGCFMWSLKEMSALQ